MLAHAFTVSMYKVIVRICVHNGTKPFLKSQFIPNNATLVSRNNFQKVRAVYEIDKNLFMNVGTWGAEGASVPQIFGRNVSKIFCTEGSCTFFISPGLGT